MNNRQKALLLGAAGVVAAGAVWEIGTWAFAWFSTHPVRLPVWLPKDAAFPVEEVAFPSRDGAVRLSGWFVPADDARGGVVLCHGHPANRMEMVRWARLLHGAGFHVLLFDFRAMGRSGGNVCSIGHHEVEDVLGAVDFLRARQEMRGLSLGVYGLSMGGAVSLMAAAQEPQIAAVATHGAYATLERAIMQRGKFLAGPLGPAFARSVTRRGQRWVEADPAEVSPLNDIAAIAPRPVLLFHGERDVLVHPDDADALHAAAAGPKTLRMLPRSYHMRIARDVLPEMERELVAFFCEHLPAE